ncbi:hypothetical protein H2201_007714 [Coniosporium apollinis]|uniref:C3H1-type domain-containing protein n=1 Tax=Coniosporium apollinis TaxID=61459 RepID=A0ABQ9NIY8_9PEZI|nr:hypothetical protein H2201_007714 [Coniosporium apollinis]
MARLTSSSSRKASTSDGFAAERPDGLSSNGKRLLSPEVSESTAIPPAKRSRPAVAVRSKPWFDDWGEDRTHDGWSEEAAITSKAEVMNETPPGGSRQSVTVPSFLNHDDEATYLAALRNICPDNLKAPPARRRLPVTNKGAPLCFEGFFHTDGETVFAHVVHTCHALLQNGSCTKKFCAFGHDHPEVRREIHEQRKFVAEENRQYHDVIHNVAVQRNPAKAAKKQRQKEKKAAAWEAAGT